MLEDNFHRPWKGHTGQDEGQNIHALSEHSNWRRPWALNSLCSRGGKVFGESRNHGQGERRLRKGNKGRSMVAKSTLTVRQVNPASFAPWARLTRNSSGESNPIGQSAHFSNHQPETDKQSSKSIAIVDDDNELRSLFSRLVKGLGYHLACVAHDGDEIVQLVL